MEGLIRSLIPCLERGMLMMTVKALTMIIDQLTSVIRLRLVTLLDVRLIQMRNV